MSNSTPAERMMTLQQAALATHGSTMEQERHFTGVSTDTRTIAAGELFVALRGEHFDGHEYLGQALSRGAAAALVDAAWMQQRAEADPVATLPLLAVTDTRRALGDLAAWWRSQFSLPLIGITGSNGKTTVKEMCASILREQARQAEHGDDHATAAPASVLATTGNLNNDIGLPLMLLKLRATHRAAVIEMGMNHPGEIAYLTSLARPTVAVITNAQRAHLEGLGGLSAVARAKGEIFAGLMPGGVGIINADDPHAAIWRELNQRHAVVTFGLTHAADVTAQCTRLQFGSRLRLVTPQGELDREVTLNLPGSHNILNALAATAATLAAGVPVDAIVAGLSGFKGVPSRLQRREAIHGALLIDDSYNANPDSVRAAIEVLAGFQGRKIFVFGDMGEVGEQSGQFHDEIGGYAKSMGVDRLLALGEHAAAAVRNFDGGGEHFKNVEALLEALRPMLDGETTVLVKGSRFMKMERVVEAIGAPEGSAEPVRTPHAT